ncbi:TPA: periplasmic heavy metal sensor [Candidatus Poribacteria bacterium]|nr:periplasmic heavy metal sensor [Candidatus Poribacteria bacterium]
MFDMRKKLLILVAILLMGFGVSLFATRYQFWRAEKTHRHESGQNSCYFLHKHLSLSESQKSNMEALDKPFRSKVNQLKAELRQKRDELSALLLESNPTAENINAKLDEIATLQVELQKVVVAHLLEIKEILTSEQQKRFFAIIIEELSPEGMSRHGGRREEGRHER